ncbi:MAG: hypothetical protein WD795_02390 [Woeseia sp.]
MNSEPGEHRCLYVGSVTILRSLLLLCATSLAACGGGGGGGGGSGPVTISGKARYQRPPPVANCNGLNFDAIAPVPIRQATIQAIDAGTDAVLDEGRTDDNGDYALTVDPDTSVFLRVRAELKRTGSPSWDVDVRDNVTDAANPVALAQRPLYVLDGSAFNSGSVALTRDITATTGWGGMSYTATRAAAPFAVLDTVYDGMLLVLAENPEASFEPLDVFWSVNNTATLGEPQDIDAGELGTSFYRSDNKLFLLGMDGVDTEEFDDHVIVHEWGHYFEDTMSRSDSIGGTHAIGDRLDMRVAFGEGFATAFSGMALDSPAYCDTLWDGGQLRGFGIDIEGQAAGTPGWFNEISIMKLIYDLWDTDVDNADTDSIGFGPVHDVMTAAQTDTAAFTSIFSFAQALKQENPAAVPFIDTLLQAEGIEAAGINAYGDGETNDGEPGALDVLPVYTEVIPDGSPINICSNSQFDPDADGNKLSEHRFLRMTIDIAAQYTFNIVTTTPMPAPDDPDDDRDQSDPDILIALNGQVQNASVGGDLEGFSGDANEEIFTTANVLAAGDYAMALVEFRYQDEESPANYPAQTCFDVSIGPVS